MGMQVELSSLDRQLKMALITIKVTIYHVHDNIRIENWCILKKNMFKITWQKSPSRCRFREDAYMIWVSCRLLMSVEVGLVDCDMAECSVFARRPVPNNPFSSSLKDGILWPSLVCASKRQKKSFCFLQKGVFFPKSFWFRFSTTSTHSKHQSGLPLQEQGPRKSTSERLTDTNTIKN